jgi:hypothetical protein
MKRIAVAIIVLALLAAACGGDVGNAGPLTQPPSNQPITTVPITGPVTSPTTSSTTQQPADPSDPVDQQFVELFFGKEGSAVSVIRAVDAPAVAANAVRALIEGPTEAEQDSDLWTAIPSDTLLLGLNIENGLATIDLSREFEVGGGSYNILSRLAQVVYTLTQFPTVDRVLFYLDGQPANVFSAEGVVLENPVRRADYATILPIAAGPGTAASEPWDQGDLPDVSDVDPMRLRRVALVAADDVLNVREDPGITAPIVGKLLSGVVVKLVGQEAMVGPTRWVQVATPAGAFWVSDWFLAAEVTSAEFAEDARVEALLDEFAAIAAAGGDLRPVASRRGLYVSHHADPVRFASEDLATILTDSTAYHWPSNAVGPEDIEEIPARTFAAAIADSFVSAYDDVDTVLTVNEPILGGNGRLPDDAIPFELESFNYIGVHDRGDNPDYDGLDWVTWYVSIDYEDGDPVIVGLTVDMWAP